MDSQIDEIAGRHGFSASAISEAVRSLRSAGGRMAQFNHPELGGFGQWMPGMMMIGDMFNSGLKARVDALFSDIAGKLNTGLLGAASNEQKGNDTWDQWYPAGLGTPSTAGAQNQMRYAYFPFTSRLAIQIGGVVTLYDTGDHEINGVSQAQSTSAQDIAFSSQNGNVYLDKLRVVTQ